MGSKRVPQVEIHWLGRSWLQELLNGTPVITWDKDSTIADTSHRQWMMDNIKSDKPTMTWDDYSLACVQDPVFEGSRVMIEALADNHIQLILTGASDSALQETRDWVAKHNLALDGLVMRPSGLAVPNGEIKVAWIRQLQGMGARIRCHVEDWDEAAQMIRMETGVPVFGFNPFYPAGNKEAEPHVTTGYERG